MTYHFSEVIRGWLGWCPRACPPVRQEPVLHDYVGAGAPVQGTGISALVGEQRRYRNQMFFWAAYFTLAFSLFVPVFLAVDLTPLMLAGILAGLGFSALSGRQLWQRFDQLARGKTVKTGPEGYVIVGFIVFTIIASVFLFVTGLLSVIPMGTALMVPAFTLGFGIFIPWYTLILILLWERRAGFILMFDRKTFSITAVQGPGDAHG